ncbi:MAG: M14-type cytosolic carboxypeptidase [Balneolaceae bacterium]
MFKIRLLIIVPILLVACKSSSKFTGFSYDPPGVANTNDKITTPQKRRVIGAGDAKIWVSNEFESARLSDFYQVDENTFEVLIAPENAPINNSPWFAFKIWTEIPRAINLRLKYKSGRHRYKPKVFSKVGTMSYAHIINAIEYDTSTGTASFPIHITENPQIISAQFLEEIRFSDLIKKTHGSLPPFVSVDTAGFSPEKRPILELTANETSPNISSGVLILLSRQHPPEVSGYRAYQAFWDELISDSELAVNFRSRFIVKAYPMVNPDGVVNGHWRHNKNGIDLNRDWENFNQPETQAIRDALLLFQNDTSKKVYYGIDFHSTNENIFYPINEEIVTFPENLTQRWAEVIKEQHPEFNFVSEEFDTSSPIAKNWIYKTFGSDAVTFEVNDELDSSESTNLGVESARSLMTLLIEEWETANNN